MTPQNLANPLPGPAPDADTPTLAEGARYALLQRLTPALQHQIMGNFQSMNMIAIMLERRSGSASPDLDSLRQDCALLGNVSDSAVKSIINMLTWVRPKPALAQRFDAGVEECVNLLVNEFKLKGFQIANEVGPVDAEICCRTLRSVVSAALVCLSDQSAGPGVLMLSALQLAGRIELLIHLQPHEHQPPGTVFANGYRLLNWKDVELLAAAESIGLERSDTGMRLVFDVPSGKN